MVEKREYLEDIDDSQYSDEYKLIAKLKRIDTIDWFISEATRYKGKKTRVSSIRLSEELEVSLATIKRDIKYMRKVLGAPIDYDKKNNTYFYKETTFRFPSIYLTDKDRYSMFMLFKFAGDYENTSMFKKAEKTWSKFDEEVCKENVARNNLNKYISEDSKDYEDRDYTYKTKKIEDSDNNFLVNIGEKKSDRFYNNLDVILEAHDMKQRIAFKYKKYNEEDIAPYQLLSKNDTNATYLVGYNNKKGIEKLEIYDLEYIRSIHLIEKYFKPDPKIELYTEKDDPRKIIPK